MTLLAQLRACRFVDLTHAFAPGIPHFHLFPDEQRTVLFGHAEGEGTLGSGFLAHEYRHIGQWGTHVDPPSHFVAGGRTLDEVGVEEMVLPLCVLDVRDRVAADVDFACSAETVLAWEAEHGRVPEGAFVAMHTGWCDRWPDDAAMQNRDAEGVAHYPGWGEDALRLLVEERGITAIGHDQTDTDPGVRVAAGEYPAETFILAADRWQVELMTGLGDLPATGAILVAAWPKPEGGSGFPARLFALVPRDA